MSELKAGVYRHYKGGFYLVLGLAHHSEHPEQHFVVYVPLYVREGPRMCVRPAKLFFDTVGFPAKPRFEYVGSEIPEAAP